MTIHRQGPTTLAFAIGAFFLGVLGTVFVMSRSHAPLPGGGKSGPPATAHEDANEHGEAHEHGEAQEHDGAPDVIKLSPEAVRTAGIRTQVVQLSALGEHLVAPGTTEVSPDRTARITPPVPGRIVRVLANPGDTVRAGQPLLVLDSFEVAEAHARVREAGSAVQQAQAALQTARVEVDQARAGVGQAQAEVDQARTKQRSAESALQRQKELAEAGSFAQPTLQAAQSELSEAQSELLKAQTELQSHAVAMQRAERLFKEELLSRSEMEQAQLEHRQDQTAVERAQSRVALVRQTLEREQRVFRGDLLTRQAVQGAEAEVRAAQGDVLKALQGVSRARQDVRRAEKGEQAARTAFAGARAALGAARANLYALEGNAHVEGTGGLLTLQAPFAGTITEKHATLGEAVERATTLFVIENVQSVLVQAQVPENELSRIRPGQPVEVTVNAYPGRRFPGVVQSLAGRVDEKTRALPVRCLVENRAGLLRPEMFARIALMVGRKAGGLQVPEGALEGEGEQRFAYVAEESGFRRRPVRAGRAFGKHVEVLEGLKPGDRVVVEGVFVLKSESRKEELKGHED